MKKWLLRVVLASVLLALGVWAWRTFFPNHEQLIRRRLLEVTEAASFPANEAPLVTVRNCKKLGTYCTPDIEIVVDVPGHSRQQISGREDLVQKALAARALGGLTVEFVDLAVTVAPDKQSAVATFIGKCRVAGADEQIVQELKFTMKRVNGEWLISRAETLKPLSRRNSPASARSHEQVETTRSSARGRSTPPGSNTGDIRGFCGMNNRLGPVEA